jgi:proteasome accessory factor B
VGDVVWARRWNDDHHQDIGAGPVRIDVARVHVNPSLGPGRAFDARNDRTRHRFVEDQHGGDHRRQRTGRATTSLSFASGSRSCFHLTAMMPHVAADDRMEPLERLLNLVGLLLATPTPLTFEQIRDVLEPYRQQNVDSAKRMFERDKDQLREFGVPLRLVDVDAWGSEQGYIIPKDEYYLPEIAFTPQELGALLVAAQSGGENTPAEQAARKLLYGADGGVLAGLAGGPLASGSDARSALVLAAADAAQRRRRIRFGYRTSHGEVADRELDAYAMVFRGGHWYVVGFDIVRQDIRAFRLSRLTSELIDQGQGTDPPDDFVAAEHVDAGPWAATAEESATIAFSPRVAWWAGASFAGAQESGTDDGGWVSFEVPMADESSLAPLVVQFGPDAEVLGPGSLRQAVVRHLQDVGQAHA